MRFIEGVQSSNKKFISLEVNVDTVYVRSNKKKWYQEDEETKELIHMGYIYDEEQYDIREYIEKISQENNDVSIALMEVINNSSEKQIEYDQAIMELTNTIMEAM